MTTPKTLSSEESFKLIDFLMTGYGTPKKKPMAVRNTTIALLMLDAGLRIGEVVRLQEIDLLIAGVAVTNLNIREGIAEKRCERLVPVSARLQANIWEMQRCWWSREADTPKNYAFYNKDSTSHISTRQIERIIGSAAEASIGRWVHPHILRHTFASNLARVTNIRVVQELLGHKQLSSTMVYTHPNSDDKSAAIKALEKGAEVDK